MAGNVLNTFRKDISSRGYTLDDRQWTDVCQCLKPIRATRGETLLTSTVIADTLIFVCTGVAASIQTSVAGDAQIARFFESGQLCSNVTSAWKRELGEDEIVAMSEFSGVSIPFSLFRDGYLCDGSLSRYWREKVFETFLFDKDLLCAKTVRDVAARYHFLGERYRHVLGTVPDRYIALFLGITPQGLSRFLKKMRQELTRVNAPAPQDG